LLIKLRRWLFLIGLACMGLTARAEPILLGTHLLLNGLAAKYLPDHRPTSYHGPYVGLNYGFKYELNRLYKTSSSSEGSDRGSLGFILGYQFLNTEVWDFSLEAFRQLVDYKDVNDNEGEDTIDGAGLRIHYSVLVFKLGFAVHGFKGSEDYYDAGYYTGFGMEYVLGRVGVSAELTDYYISDRDKHLSGFEVGLKYYFDNSTGAL
jgi:hypothetical protein